MFAVLYRFDIKPGKEERFIRHWKTMTRLISRYEGGLGSRLHKSNDEKYYAYAQWPDKNTWENSGDHLPAEVNKHRRAMRECCETISTIHQFEVLEDLLQK